MKVKSLSRVLLLATPWTTAYQVPLTFHPKIMNFTFFSSAHGTFSRTDHILGHKSAAAAKSLQLCPTLHDPMAAAYQDLLPMGFSRQEYWSGLPSLGHISSLGKFKKIEIIPSIFSDHNAVRLDVNYRRKTI